MPLAIFAPVTVVATFAGSGRLVPAGAYLSGVALAVAILNWRSGDHSRAARIAIIVSGISLVAGAATLAFAVGLMGVPALWFMGSG